MNPTVDHSDANNKKPILKVAVPIPLFGSFDYLIPESLRQYSFTPGCRVEVPFGRRTSIGVILEQTDHSDFALNKLKPINKLIDSEAVLDTRVLDLLRWASSYYLHPIGEVVQAALPSLLRQGKPAEAAVIKVWKTTDSTSANDLEGLNRAAKQKHILQILLNSPEGLGESYLNDNHPNWRPAMKALLEKGLAGCVEQASLPEAHPISTQAPSLNDEQTQAIETISEDLSQHHIHLLHGVTGSGKTEVYLALSERVIASGKQVLVLVPEISLTPQLTQRFQQRMGCPIAVLHSGLNDQQRLSAWHAASTGHARLVIGTRSAIFTPLPELGLIVVDEEHDGSYKQQEGFRYNARDLALVRSQKENIPVVLGSATPSLESLHNVNRQRFHIHTLKQRARTQSITRIKLLDMCSQPIQEGLSAALLVKVEEHLKQGNQVILFLNRRGFSPLMMCHDCGWMTRCKRCDANMTYHKHKHQLHCHHCGAETRSPTQCGDCGSEELLAIGTGTERIEDFLTERFPDVPINRIDRDTTRRKGALEDKLQQAHAGGASILVGTQMLAKGHDFPNVTLVGVLDTDQALYSADFRAAEHLAQLIIQVSGRAGRAEKPGEVLIQTHHPDHPLLQTLLHQGYEKFAESALVERQQAGFPPHKHLVLLRCGAIKKELGMLFMREARELANSYNAKEVEIFGPWPAPMEKRAGRFRTQTMLQANDRKALHQLLRQWLPRLQQLKSSKQIRWSIDVDPYDTF
ncbi:MAG: primosomal protein N' [Gammaproteobacteria bacterium]|nr:primosomal protein N' [Gammaproteobacteria bacterium]